MAVVKQTVINYYQFHFRYSFFLLCFDIPNCYSRTYSLEINTGAKLLGLSGGLQMESV